MQNITILTTALQQLPPFEDPLWPALVALAASDLTLGALLELGDLVASCSSEADNQLSQTRRMAKQCFNLPPISSPQLPIGY